MHGISFHAERGFQSQIFAVIEKATWRNSDEEHYSLYNCFHSFYYGSLLKVDTQECVWMCCNCPSLITPFYEGGGGDQNRWHLVLCYFSVLFSSSSPGLVGDVLLQRDQQVDFMRACQGHTASVGISSFAKWEVLLNQSPFLKEYFTCPLGERGLGGSSPSLLSLPANRRCSCDIWPWSSLSQEHYWTKGKGNFMLLASG